MGLIALVTSTGNANSTRLRLAQFHALLVPVTRAINPHIALSTVLLTIHIVPMAKLSFERGFLASVQWGWITVRYTELRGVRYSGVSIALEYMEKRSGLLTLSVVSCMGVSQ